MSNPRPVAPRRPVAAKRKYPAFVVGPLPVDKINQALGVDLAPGVVSVSSACHRHIAEDHPDDYPHIMEALASIVTGPLYIGQDPKHADNFYVVRPLPEGAPNPYGLVAIGFERNKEGGYRVKSAYTINQVTVDKRRAARCLHRIL